MKISIIIPTLNPNKHFFLETLNSIFTQSYQNFEVIVVDSGSKGTVASILKTHMLKHPKFYYIYRKPQGEPDAICKGFEIATGDILAFMDADDTYEPDAFQKVVDAFSHSNKLWCYGKAKIIDSNSNEVRSYITTIKSLFWAWPNKYTLLCLDYIVQPTVFIRRELWKEIGTFNVKEPLVCDYEYWLRAMHCGHKPLFINDWLANTRVHPGTMSTKNQMQQIDDAYRWQRKYNKWLLPIQYLIKEGTKWLYSKQH